MCGCTLGDEYPAAPAGTVDEAYIRECYCPRVPSAAQRKVVPSLRGLSWSVLFASLPKRTSRLWLERTHTYGQAYLLYPAMRNTVVLSSGMSNSRSLGLAGGRPTFMYLRGYCEDVERVLRG